MNWLPYLKHFVSTGIIGRVIREYNIVLSANFEKSVIICLLELEEGNCCFPLVVNVWTKTWVIMSMWNQKMTLWAYTWVHAQGPKIDS